MSAPAAERKAIGWIKKAISDRIDELTDQWKGTGEDEIGKREKIHAEVKATIELEDYLSARIREYAAG